MIPKLPPKKFYVHVYKQNLKTTLEILMSQWVDEYLVVSDHTYTTFYPSITYSCEGLHGDQFRITVHDGYVLGPLGQPTELTRFIYIKDLPSPVLDEIRMYKDL